MREVDISYTVTVVLYAMCPPSARAPITMQNFKTASDYRSGSFSLNKSAPAVTKSLYQVAFLGKSSYVLQFISFQPWSFKCIDVYLLCFITLSPLSKFKLQNSQWIVSATF
jgi:hypothetical protein